MVQSKEWDWKSADRQRWMTPSEDSEYLARKWTDEGARSILDLGCGLGRHAFFFTEKGFDVAAVDLSEEAVHSVKEGGQERNMDFPCQVADMMKLPFLDNAFDRVFSYHVISHQDTPGVQAVIDEITRVLKTEGAEVDVPHFFADKKILNKLFHEYTFEHVRHITECIMEEDDSKERSHYYIEATVRKNPGEQTGVADKFTL